MPVQNDVSADTDGRQARDAHRIQNLFFSGAHINGTEVTLVVLGLIDVVMIANLLIMVIIGGYETFVFKLSTAIIGISSIHLLKTFINAANMDPHTIQWQVVIHVVFLCSALAMVWVDRIMTLTLSSGRMPHVTPHK